MNKSWIDKNLIAVPIEEVSTPKTGHVARVGAFRKGHTITAEHRALMEAGKAERKARRLSHSAAKRITFRKKRPPYRSEQNTRHALLLHAEAFVRH
ncbi:hypothetical protein [Klebsiella pneumoniae]|uniref:hypothetical protein n=1 Tax=Klebsiella pneumoniae TaxID=573 RepID=UPI00114D4334|nr:hypothetical protein [Klebsiella pneumoniae]